MADKSELPIREQIGRWLQHMTEGKKKKKSAPEAGLVSNLGTTALKQRTRQLWRPDLLDDYYFRHY